ncbi:hypothetical protein A7U43_28490 (plasmid) [Mycobacterium adipatum]|uniref:Uncharacterized protein n=1 Tax=Mycobacterium adipatum TaxID=1682113 RepID=A0A172UWJ6_9MYCO|nr:hypothetical protein A7U43_28490 [Mycobacterium adipatum]
MAFLAGCQGQEEPAAAPETTTTSAAAASGVDVAQLEPGNYPTQPQAKPAPSAQAAVVVEAQRMAEFVVGPWEVDPSLVAQSPFGTLVIKNAEDVDKVAVAPTSEVAAARKFINGFGTSRNNDADSLTSLQNMVLRFPTQADAEAAAYEIHTQLTAFGNATAMQALPIPGHEGTFASRTTLEDDRIAITSFTAHGPYLLYQEARSPESAEAGVALVARTLDLQKGRIDGFTPVSPDEFATMDLDPTNLMVRTLPADGAVVTRGVYGPYGILHFQGSPIRASEFYTDAGVDAAAVSKTWVYQTRDEAAAKQLADNIAALVTDAQPGPSVPGMPEAKCFVNEVTAPVAGRNYRCVGTAGRWTITSGSQQDFDATQQLAAQYLLLVGT